MELASIADANEIRLRAERRLSEMMAAQPKAPGGRPYQSTGFSKNPVTDKLATLIDAGIDKNLEADANEIRMRAERRLGEMMDEGKDDRPHMAGIGDQRILKTP
jgi:hypothetical protein